MRLSNTSVSFARMLSPLEKIEARAYCQEAKEQLALKNLAFVTHSVSLPSDKNEDIGIGILSKNQGAISYVDFLYDSAIDSLSVEPMGIIKGDYYSPYDGSLLSKKPIVDLKALCGDDWGNLLDIDEFNLIVQNKDYLVNVPTSSGYKTTEFDKDMVLYDYVLANQETALKKAYSNFLKKFESKDPIVISLNQEFEEFKKHNDYFLKGDAIYTLLNKKHGTYSYSQWQNPLHQTLFDFSDDRFSVFEKEQEIKRLESENKEEIDFYKFCQFVVDKQQKDFVKYASKIGQARYEKDLNIIENAFLNGEISKEKYLYLKAKIEEYKNQGKGVNIIGDKQVGYSDMDIFSNPCIFTKDEFMGAPPNLLRGSAGQDWDFKFIPYEKLFNKDGTLALGGQYLKKTIKKAFQDNPGGLRIDHIIGLIDPWTYQKGEVGKLNGAKFSLFLSSQFSKLQACGINANRIANLDDVVGALTGQNVKEHEILKQYNDIDFEKAKTILSEKQEFLDEILQLNVLGGSRHIFNYLLENQLAELKEYGLNKHSIMGVIDPIQAIFVENSLDRKMLVQNGVSDFGKIKQIFISKKDEIEKIYTNVIEKIVLASAKEVIEERSIKNGVELTDSQKLEQARNMVMCEDLGALTIPVKAVMKKYGLNGMRNAARSNPNDPTHIHREINPNERGNFWTISTHDTPPYKDIFSSFDEELQQAHIDYVASEMNLNSCELSDKRNLWKFVQAKVARLFVADKNLKTPNNVMLNWLDFFDAKKAYNTPGSYDKTKNWVLRVCPSSDSFERRYFEDILPNKKGINLFDAYALALKACFGNNENAMLIDELNRLSAIAQE